MRLTLYTDYSLRVLIYLSSHRDEWISTEEMSSFYGISNHHLVKAVNHLGHLKFITIKRGRSGGVKLAKDPAQINLADVIQATEPDFHITECFNVEANTCPISATCGLKSVLKKANQSFIQTLQQYTLADIIEKPRKKVSST
jgi:Rrf2 family nitric oxide-sensitive transcriptional repressor